MELAAAALISMVVGMLISFLYEVFFFVMDFYMAVLTLMPTDPFNGVLDVSSEPFTEYLPWINWFVPLDYAVTLMGVFLDVYALYIIYKYTSQIIKNVLDGNGLGSIVAGIISIGG